jgi:hypothetical protein
MGGVLVWLFYFALLCFFFGGGGDVVGLQLRASCLLGRRSTN